MWLRLGYGWAVSLPSGQCPHCGAELTNMRSRGEYALVAPDTRRVHGTQRMFLGDCPDHGPMFALHKIGHHSTLGSKALRRRYPGRFQRIVKANLTSKQRSRFSKAMRGQYHPTPADIRHWDTLASGQVQASPTSLWLGAFHFAPVLKDHA